MDDYIFIILAIALAIVSTIARKKKKDQGQDSTHSPKTNLFERYFDELIFDDKQATPQVEVAQAPVAPPKEKGQKGKASPRPFLTNELKERIPRKENKISKVENIQVSRNVSKKTINHSVLLKNFSLKKAVVYSEIINRKY